MWDAGRSVYWRRAKIDIIGIVVNALGIPIVIRRNGVTVEPKAFQMKIQCFQEFGQSFLRGLTGSHTPWNIGRESSPVVRTRLEDNDVLHTYPA